MFIKGKRPVQVYYYTFHLSAE